MRIASRPLAIRLRDPGVDVRPRKLQRIAVVAQVMGQRATALLAGDQHDLDAMARQQPRGRIVDGGRQHLLRAALQERDTPAPLAGR